MTKYIYVTMPDNSQYKIPASIIASDRARHYEKHHKDDFDAIFEETIVDDDIILDWGRNNMDWDEVKEHAILVINPDVDYDDGWLNGNKFINIE